MKRPQSALAARPKSALAGKAKKTVGFSLYGVKIDAPETQNY